MSPLFLTKESGRDVDSAPVRESALLDTRTLTAVSTPPESPESSPTVPAAVFCLNPDDGICRQKTAVPKQRGPVPLPCEEPREECSRILPAVAPNAALSSDADCAALERLPDLIAPSAARRRALAVMLHEQHREPDRLGAPAHYAGTTSLSGQPIAAQTAPPRTRAPACRPPKGRHAARSRLSVLASCGSHPACRCAHLD